MALTGQTGQNQGSRVPAGFEVRAVPRWPKDGLLFILCLPWAPENPVSSTRPNKVAGRRSPHSDESARGMHALLPGTAPQPRLRPRVLRRGA